MTEPQLSPIQPQNLLKPRKIHPLLGSLPKHLKDHKNFDKVQRLILESLAGKHSHSDIQAWATCASCQKRFSERRNVLKKLGFKHPAQYMLWKRTHEMIKGMYKKYPLEKYDSKDKGMIL